MPLKIEDLVTGKLVPRNDKKVPLLDEPILGHMQAVVLKKVKDLGSEASGLKVLQELSTETGVWIDHAQVYASIRKLAKRSLIESDGERKSGDGGPPYKIYKLTAEGRSALKEVAEHHSALASFLNNKRK